MSDTIRTQGELLSIFADNTRGLISAQDIRDLTITALNVDRGGQVFNVKAYGAKGDGITDDTIAFQNAVNAAGDTGVVFVPQPESFYRVTGPVYLSCSIVGSGMPEIRMDAGTGDGSVCILVVNTYSGDGLTISGLHLNGQWSGGTVGESDHAIKIGNSSNVTVRGNKIENTYGDCVFIGPVTSGINVVTIGKCDRIRV